MKAVLLIPDGVGVRNFLIGPFLHLASELDECHVLHVIPDGLLPNYRNGNKNVGWHTLFPYAENSLSAVLRYAIAFAHMNWGDTQAMRYVRNRPIKGSWRRRGVQYAAKFTGRLAASPTGIQTLDRWHCGVVERMPEVERYRQLFLKIKPSVVFCSHQRPPIVLPATLAARSLGIPTATFIFS